MGIISTVDISYIELGMPCYRSVDCNYEEIMAIDNETIKDRTAIIRGTSLEDAIRIVKNISQPPSIPMKFINKCVVDIERQLDALIPGSEAVGYTAILRDYLKWMVERCGCKVVE